MKTKILNIKKGREGQEKNQSDTKLRIKRNFYLKKNNF